MFTTILSAALLLAGHGVVVSPAQPAPTQAVTVSFTAPAAVGDGSRWYSVSVTAPSRAAGCGSYEETTTPAAAKGARVTLTLRPYDKRRWCAGRYVGALVLERRVA